jgi:hypothetical protein
LYPSHVSYRLLEGAVEHRKALVVALLLLGAARNVGVDRTLLGIELAFGRDEHLVLVLLLADGLLDAAHLRGLRR